MINLNPELIKIPSFMTKFINLESLTFIEKIILIIKGKITSFALNSFGNKYICKFFNLFFKFEGSLVFKDGNYIKKSSKGDLYYPNTRFTRIIVNQNEFLEYLFNSYMLNYINFVKNDFVIDCGANVGELYMAFGLRNISIKYIGIEPESQTFYCLNKNTHQKNLNFCLSDIEEEVEMFVDGVGANTSIIRSKTTETVIKSYSKRLDTVFTGEKIKLLKIDAEGAEPEVLKGCKNIFSNIEYISVDCGKERGMEQESTFHEVNNIMNENKFEIIDIFQPRLVVLYRNKR